MRERSLLDELRKVRTGRAVCRWGPAGVASLVLSMKWELWNVFCRGVHALTSVLAEHLTALLRKDREKQK